MVSPTVYNFGSQLNDISKVIDSRTFQKNSIPYIDSIVQRIKRKWFTALCWSRAKLTEASLYLDHPSFERGHKNQHGLFKVDKVVVTPWNMT